MIEKGKRVSIEYKLEVDEGEELFSQHEKDSLSFISGSNQILPALEERICQFDVGEDHQIVLLPEEAYGQINPGAFKEVDAALIPYDLCYEGALLSVQDQQFGELLIRVDSLNDDKALLDFNHPFAGKKLTFEVKIVAVV